MIENHPLIKRIIGLAMAEDLATGDVTTDVVIGPEKKGKATLIAREETVLAGMEVFEHVFVTLDADMACEAFFVDGDLVPAGRKVAVITGQLCAIMKGERTALNFLQRMSGIATLTRQYVEKIEASKARLLDTRKTVPGHRVLDKYAVKIGGGFNHRFNLSDGILIKDNHIAAAGSIKKAVALAKANAPLTLKVEVEVEDLNGLEEALAAGADIIMLDNMSLRQMREAVQKVNGRVRLEASGGISLDTIVQVAETGVDFISVGMLTHSPKAADLSLEVVES